MKKLSIFLIFFCVVFSSLSLIKSYNNFKINYNKVLPPIHDSIIVPKSEEELKELARESITYNELQNMLRFIASDTTAGRGPGTRGFELAAHFVESEFKSYGLNVTKQLFKDRYGRQTWNTIGYFEGNKLKNEYIIIGAHLDHLGQKGRYTYYGADDNGSGIVALLEIAEAVSAIKNDISRSVIFIAFSAEEQGLIGSKFYVNNPVYPLNKTIAMFNMDMVGNLKTTNKLGCYGAKASKIFDISSFAQLNKDKINLEITSKASRNSDHANFQDKNIPIIFFHTGTTSIYHTPRDTIEKIDFDGITKISKFIFEIYCKLDKEEIHLTAKQVPAIIAENQ